MATAAKINAQTGQLAAFYNMMDAVKMHKFTLREVQILLLLPKAGTLEGPSGKDIVAVTGTNGPSVTRGTKALIDAELALSVRHPTDARRICVSRTRAGDALIARIEQAGRMVVLPSPRDTQGL